MAQVEKGWKRLERLERLERSSHPRGAATFPTFPTFSTFSTFQPFNLSNLSTFFNLSTFSTFLSKIFSNQSTFHNVSITTSSCAPRAHVPHMSRTRPRRRVLPMDCWSPALLWRWLGKCMPRCACAAETTGLTRSAERVSLE